MKRIIIAVGLVLMLTSCDQTKIAYVNVDKVLKEYDGLKNSEKAMKEKADKIMAELEPMMREFQFKVQEFQKESSGLSAKVRAEKEQQLVQEQQGLQQRQQMVQQQVQQESQQLYIEMDKKIDSLIAIYAKSNSYSFILGTSPQTKSVVYGDETSNITDQVIESINKSYDSEGSNSIDPVIKDSAVVK